MMNNKTDTFDQIVGQISNIGYDLHANTLIEHAHQNLPYAQKTIKHLPLLEGDKKKSAIVISAGPSIHKQQTIKKILEHKYKGTTVCVDGSYIACLKAGLIPDFVLTLDPHKTRLVRWFGDHNFEEHAEKDDYFARQDLDVDFRKNSLEHNRKNIELVNRYGHLTKAIISSSAPANVRERLIEAKFDMYWWNPLVDNPNKPESLTRRIHSVNKWPCMNTGGNVGSAAWVFANAVLKCSMVALTGMDMGYYIDTPKTQTQLYYEIIHHLGTDENIDDCFKSFEFPLTGEKFYTDPTYFWYRKNLLELLEDATGETYNCTEGGTVFGDKIKCEYLDNFLKLVRSEED